MNTVEPIRELDVVKDIQDYLKVRSERNYVLFTFGICTGLRISDILKFRVRDVRGKDCVYIREQKTGKEKKFKLKKSLRSVLDEYIRDKKDYEYLFKSNKGLNKPITREQAYRILSEAGQVFGLSNIGTHTLRKTFGYHMYKQTGDVAMLMEIFNHAAPSITLRYIGITQIEQDKAIENLPF